jgi:hypothetical protein
MFNSQDFRRLFLAAAAAGLLTVAGCSNQATDQATNQAPAPPKKAVASKPVASKTAAAKPAAKKADSGKVVAAKGKGATAKPVAVSSKVAPQTTLVTVPKGTAISAVVGETLASNKNHAGDTFAATLSSPIKVDGKTVIAKGAKVTGRVVTAKKSSAELTVALASVDVNGKSYKLVSDPISRTGKAPAKSDAGDADAAKAKEKKDVTLPEKSRLKFKLAKDVKIPVAVKS